MTEEEEARLRAAGAFDVGLLAALHSAAFADQPAPEIWGKAAMAEILAMPGCLALIVERRGAPQGFLLARVASEEAEILSLGIRPTARGCGLANALVDCLLRRLRELGAEEVYLEVAEDNVAAQKLYQKAGFEPHGRRSDYYRRPERSVDALILRYQLR